jgi:hypothetical protein
MDFDDESVLSGVRLPVQFYSAAPPTPYRHLLAAILEDAIWCFQKNCGARSLAATQYFERRKNGYLIVAALDSRLLSQWCESLGIDPIKIRQYLRNGSWTNKPVGLCGHWDGLGGRAPIGKLAASHWRS